MTVPILKIKVLPKPILKGKMDVRFPAKVETNNFLTVERANGIYTFDIDYSLLSGGPISDPTTAYIAVQDQTSGIYRTVSLASILTGGLDADLQAIAALTGTGLLIRTADGTWALRSLAAPAAGITITNPAGIAGNPTFALANDLASLEGLSSTGIARRTGADAWSVGTAVANSELATMASNTFKGNVSGSPAVPADLTAAQVTAALPVATSLAKGLAPQLPNDATKFLDGTGVYSIPPSGGGGTFIQAGTGAIVRTMQDKARDIVSVLDFGADPTFTNDSTAAFNAAITAAQAAGGKAVYVPGGTYKISSTIAITTNPIELYGDSSLGSCLKSPNANNPIITVATGLSGISIHHLFLDRAVIATSGGDGIQWALNGVADGEMHHLRVWHQYNGLQIGGCALAWLYHIRSEYNQQFGVLQIKNDTAYQLQIFVDNIYVGSNGSDGYSVRSSVSATSGAATGNFSRILSFANAGHGFSAVGTASAPIHSIRITDSFFGQDNGSEVYLNTYSTNNQISNSFIELCGTLNGCGPDGNIPASGVGHGIEVNTNNLDVMINNVICNGNSQSGFALQATNANIVTGCRSTYNINYGYVFSDGTKSSLTGSIVLGNTIAPVIVATNSSKLMASGNIPTTLNTTAQNVISTIAQGSAVSLVSGTGKNLTSISLDPGDYEVEANFSFTGGGTTTVTYTSGSISLISNTLDQTNGRSFSHYFGNQPILGSVPSGILSFSTMSVRLTITTTTTIYAVAQALFSTSTLSVFGVLKAQRLS